MRILLIILAESARSAFFMFFAPITGLVKGGLRGIRNEYHAIEIEYRQRVKRRLERERP